jgi:ParB family chromosome partitioning protein
LQPQVLAIDQILPSPYQPRQHYDAAALTDLSESIRRQGVLQPLLVRPVADRFEIVAGERRWRAAKMAGLGSVPVVVKELSDLEALQIAIVENLQREDLTPIEEARAYQALAEQGMTHAQIAESVSKARSTITNALRLLELPDGALEALEQDRITPGHARAILAQAAEDREWALEQILRHQLTVRQAEQLVHRGNQLPEQARPSRSHAGRAEGQALSLELSRQLGTRVLVSALDRGVLQIYYDSAEELEEILGRLGFQVS